MRHVPNVTIAIPTYNRSALLTTSMKSVLKQDYPDFQILVLDNASSDDTEEAVRSFSDNRITYIRNEKNMGLFRNWRQAIELNSSPYLHIFQDDDVMLEGFIRESVLELDGHPQASFSFALARSIDINGNKCSLLDAQDLPDAGVMNGMDYLHRIVEGHHWVIYTSSVMMRSSAIAEVGPFENTHAVYSMDYNLYFRLASRFDIIFINKELIEVRKHAGQITQSDFAGNGPKGQLPLMAERSDVIAYLLTSPRAQNKSYRQWLADRLLYTSMQRSQLTHQLVPDLTLSWSESLEIAQQEIEKMIPVNDRFILVDEDKWVSGMSPQHNMIPFLERDGRYWGAPPDDATAIREFKRLWKSGARFIVFGWPAFWWLDYYGGFRDYLESKFRCILKNSRLIIFDLDK